MIGPLLSFPSANGAVEFDVRALVGVLGALSPELVTVFEDLRSFLPWNWVRF